MVVVVLLVDAAVELLVVLPLVLEVPVDLSFLDLPNPRSLPINLPLELDAGVDELAADELASVLSVATGTGTLLMISFDEEFASSLELL